MHFDYQQFHIDASPLDEGGHYYARAKIYRRASVGSDAVEVKYSGDLGDYSSDAAAIEAAQRWAIQWCDENSAQATSYDSSRITVETHMAEGKEQFEEHEGFTIRVLVIPEYSPHPPDIQFGYVGYVCRPSADIRYSPSKVNFSHAVPDLPNAEAAEQAGFAEGRSIIDRTHPDLTVDGL